MGLALKAAAEAAAPRRRIVRRMLGKSVVGTDVQIESKYLHFILES
jgi:hypothetical protein